MYVGDFALGSTFDVKFLTAAAATGAPTTLAGSPVVSAYLDNNTTELTAGITLSVDFDSRTGMHNVRVVASGGNGYAAGVNYQLVLTAGTVGGTSVVGYVIGQFSIENRSALRPTTAARTLDVTATGEAGIDWSNIGSPTATVALTGTTSGLIDGAITAAKLASAAITAAKFGAGALDANALATDAVNEIVAAVKAMVVESNGSITMGQAFSIFLAFAAGVSTGQSGTSPIFKDPSGTSNRIAGTTDGSGNRSAVTLTPSS